MSHITTYKAKVELPITYQWQCSKCGTVNRVSTKIYSEDTQYGTGSKIDDSIKKSTSARAAFLMDSSLGTLYGKYNNIRLYRGLGLTRACENCNHKELWAVKNDFKRNSSLNVVAITLIVFALFGFVFSIADLLIYKKFSINNLGFPALCLGIAAITYCCLIVARKIYSNKDEKINKLLQELPLASRPVLVVDNKPVVDVELTEKKEPVKEKHINTKQNIKKGVQQNESDNHPTHSEYSAADEIEKFKNLLDKEIITQEEFDAKKKQLLGL